MPSFPSTARSRFKKLLSSDRGPVNRMLSAFSTDPPIFYIMFGYDYHELYRALGSRRAIFLVMFAWNFDGEKKARKLSRRVKNHQRHYRGHRFIFLCNTADVESLLTKAGLEAIFASQSGLLDDRIFVIQPDVERRFDALYDAQIAPFKRHLLAAKVESLALIAYTTPIAYEKEYGDRVLRSLAHAHWFRNPLDPTDAGPLDAVGVAEAINACRVGLCLSAEEGAMYASAQYLLCGLPVVSTHSRGGRDEFFDPEFTRIVEDDPAAVASAVDELVSLDLDPERIRSATLPKIRKHRQRVIDLVGELHQEAGVDWQYPGDWERAYFNKMIGYSDLREIRRWLAHRRLPLSAPSPHT